MAAGGRAPGPPAGSQRRHCHTRSDALSWLKDAVARLAAYPVLFVGVRCPVEELERRERARYEGREAVLQVAWQARRLAGLHAQDPYDLVVDTTTASPEALAQRIKRRLQEGPPPAAFRRLRGSPILDEPDDPPEGG